MTNISIAVTSTVTDSVLIILNSRSYPVVASGRQVDRGDRRHASLNSTVE